jgi:hypothetical protein
MRDTTLEVIAHAPMSPRWSWQQFSCVANSLPPVGVTCTYVIAEGER